MIAWDKEFAPVPVGEAYEVRRLTPGLGGFYMIAIQGFHGLALTGFFKDIEAAKAAAAEIDEIADMKSIIASSKENNFETRSAQYHGMWAEIAQRHGAIYQPNTRTTNADIRKHFRDG